MLEMRELIVVRISYGIVHKDRKKFLKKLEGAEDIGIGSSN